MSTDPAAERHSVLATNLLAGGAGEHEDDERGSTYICKSESDGLGSTKDRPKIPTALAMVNNLDMMNYTSSSTSTCNSNRWGIISQNNDDLLTSSTTSPVLLLNDARLNLTPHTVQNPSSGVVATDDDWLEHRNPSFDQTTTTKLRVSHRSLPSENGHVSDHNNNNMWRPQGTHPQHQQTSNPSLGVELPASNPSPSSKKKHKLHKNKEEEEEEEEMVRVRVRKRKERKIMAMKKYLLFFHDAMERLVEKQEEMQQKFLEALERRDEERVVREVALKRQEMARLNIEHSIRVGESVLSASRDSSLIEFLHKAVAHEQGLINLSNANNISPIPDNIVIHAPCVSTQQYQQQPDTLVPFNTIDHAATAPKVNPSSTTAHNVMVSQDEVSHDFVKKEVPGLTHGTKRWPTLEVLALIKLRTKLNKRFHEPGSKALLWEEISTEMGSQGFNRPPKRCKEKWENINKYFKKAKESKKTRPENANTCPYFHHLNALYKQGLLGSGKHVSNMNVKDRSPKTGILGGNESTALRVEEIKHPSKNPAAVSDEDSQGSETGQDIAVPDIAVPRVRSMRNDEALTILSSVSSNIIAKSNMLTTSNSKTYQITTQI